LGTNPAQQFAQLPVRCLICNTQRQPLPGHASSANLEHVTLGPFGLDYTARAHRLAGWLRFGSRLGFGFLAIFFLVISYGTIP
jgi:hypothetical protein